MSVTDSASHLANAILASNDDFPWKIHCHSSVRSIAFCLASNPRGSARSTGPVPYHTLTQ